MKTRRGVKLTFFIVVAAIAGIAAQSPSWVAPLSAMAAGAATAAAAGAATSAAGSGVNSRIG